MSYLQQWTHKSGKPAFLTLCGTLTPNSIILSSTSYTKNFLATNITPSLLVSFLCHFFFYLGTVQLHRVAQSATIILCTRLSWALYKIWSQWIPECFWFTLIFFVIRLKTFLTSKINVDLKKQLKPLKITL